MDVVGIAICGGDEEQSGPYELIGSNEYMSHNFPVTLTEFMQCAVGDGGDGWEWGGAIGGGEDDEEEFSRYVLIGSNDYLSPYFSVTLTMFINMLMSRRME